MPPRLLLARCGPVLDGQPMSKTATLQRFVISSTLVDPTFCQPAGAALARARGRSGGFNCSLCPHFGSIQPIHDVPNVIYERTTWSPAAPLGIAVSDGVILVPLNHLNSDSFSILDQALSLGIVRSWSECP